MNVHVIHASLHADLEYHALPRSLWQSLWQTLGRGSLVAYMPLEEEELRLRLGWGGGRVGGAVTTIFEPRKSPLQGHA